MADFKDMNCSVARALDEVGERWSLLIIREAIMGSTRFDEFHERLGVARNILADRLASLTQSGILTRTISPGDARIHHYALTEKGRDLLPVIAAMMHWGDRWMSAAAGPPVVLVDRKTRAAIPRVTLRRAKGGELGWDDIAIEAGRGAAAPTRARLRGSHRPHPQVG
jgi:DNA-binding HxlR family transcriptional regulator